MKKKLICALLLVAVVLSMSGCIEDVSDGLHKAGDWVEDNKEALEDGMQKIQDGIIDASDNVNQWLHEQKPIKTTDGKDEN